MKTQNDQAPSAPSPSRPVSPLSAFRWAELATLAKVFSDASQALEFAMLRGAQTCEEANDHALRDHFLATVKAHTDANALARGMAYGFTPQGEWLGGEAFATREPHFTGGRRHNVPSAQEDELPANLDGFPSGDELIAHAAIASACNAPAEYVDYCHAKALAMRLRAQGQIPLACTLEKHCDRLCARLPHAWRW